MSPPGPPATAPTPREIAISDRSTGIPLIEGGLRLPSRPARSPRPCVRDDVGARILLGLADLPVLNQARKAV